MMKTLIHVLYLTGLLLLHEGRIKYYLAFREYHL
jgi:hypothetical protein